MAFAKDDYIAVFDSGLGGLSVLRHLKRIMPNERYLYYGDCANAPYGTRTTDQVRELTLAAAAHLLQNYPVKALVVACNTATAAAIGHLRSLYPELIVIGIEPALKLAADRHPGGTIGVMATQVTLREEKFQKLWERFAGGCTVHPIQVPGLVELVEAGKEDSAETDALLRRILQPYIGKLDALVLGCTHYPFLEGAIRRVTEGKGVTIVNPAPAVARRTEWLLREADMLAEEGHFAECSFVTFGSDEYLARIIRKAAEIEE
jgi:glutamate racemase